MPTDLETLKHGPKDTGVLDLILSRWSPRANGPSRSVACLVSGQPEGSSIVTVTPLIPSRSTAASHSTAIETGRPVVAARSATQIRTR